MDGAVATMNPHQHPDHGHQSLHRSESPGTGGDHHLNASGGSGHRRPSKHHMGHLEALESNDVQDLILSCNKDGMESLRKATGGRHDPHLRAAFDQFKYAEAVLLANQAENDNTALLAVTCNNLGCYYKKVGKFHGALSYLRRALKMEVELRTDEVTVASTHLNLCAVLSKLEKHDKAVQHAMSALELMSKRIAQSEVAMAEDEYSVLAIVYHNVAMEREHLQQIDQAATAFQTGFQVAKRLLGEQHPLAITLGKNCEAMVARTRTAKSKPPPRPQVRAGGWQSKEQDDESRDVLGGLPQLPGAADQGSSPSSKPEKKNVRNEAMDWIRSEEALWVNFANKALRPHDRPDSSGHDDHPESTEMGMMTPRRLQPIAAIATREMPSDQPIMPHSHDMGAFRFQLQTPKQILKKTPLHEALDKNPEALMDLIDAEGDVHASLHAAPNDFRPHRSMKRSTRTSRVVRRTGVHNSTTHRDRVALDLEKKRLAQKATWKSVQTQKEAAERIQRVWRAWFEYCQEHSEWMTITWICATMIQSHWRSYHVRRQRLDAKANMVQRHMRGFLVRRVMKKHQAAVMIQKHVVGMLTRRKLKELHAHATQMQRLVRGGLARKHFKDLHRYKFSVVVTIQKFVRSWLARRRYSALLSEKRHRIMLWRATVDLQRMFRGWKGRQKAKARKEEMHQTVRQFMAAQKLQSHVRGRQARANVEELRAQRQAEMDKAATFLRKMWIGARTRKQYLKLQDEFKGAEVRIVTIQRYLRGCMCRLKMWREALKMEEEHWAALEIQRSYRGYRGRVRWEDEYEIMWRREFAAALIQRNALGYLVRAKMSRRRRAMARAEFESARSRFRAAQRIQALARGVLVRKVVRVRLARANHAATQIQRIHRGRMLRKKLWEQVVHQRTTMITAAARGFLVRKRRYHLLVCTIYIQRAYRRRLQRPAHIRAAPHQKMLERKEKATVIQRHFRARREQHLLQKLEAPPADFFFKGRQWPLKDIVSDDPDTPFVAG